MCTGICFADKENNLYFGRNLDWSNSYGEKVVVTPAGYSPKSPFKAIKEIKYPVIGMGIIEENTPLYFDCANNQGLAVAGLNFPGYTKYASPNRNKMGEETIYEISAYEFPLWITSQHKTVEEVKSHLL